MSFFIRGNKESHTEQGQMSRVVSELGHVVFSQELIRLSEQVHCHGGKTSVLSAQIRPDNSTITSMVRRWPSSTIA